MIKIICVGKLKEKFWVDACSEYLKRIKKYTKLELIEVMDEKTEDEKEALLKEKERIEKHIGSKDYVITLEIEGKMYSSIELSERLEKIQMINSNITFIIGGSCGIHPEIKKKANEKISFSQLTFPHQLFRILLLEQIYRSFKIQNNERYHK